MFTSSAVGGPGFWVVYVLFLVGIMYFMAYRPQSKQKKEHEALMASIAVGDTVLTSSGFYGVIMDMTEDTVIVEFGNNKNCRIPMKKTAIVEIEKPMSAKQAAEKAAAEKAEPEKKSLFGKKKDKDELK